MSLNVFLTVLQQLFVVLFSFISCINVIRDKSTLSDPDAKIYIEQSCSEEIRIFYDQITEIKTGKILNAAELKQFLKAEESN